MKQEDLFVGTLWFLHFFNKLSWFTQKKVNKTLFLIDEFTFALIMKNRRWIHFCLCQLHILSLFMKLNDHISHILDWWISEWSTESIKWSKDKLSQRHQTGFPWHELSSKQTFTATNFCCESTKNFIMQTVNHFF